MGGTDVIASVKGKGGDALSTELAVALRHCLLGGKRVIYLFFIYVISDCKNCLWRQVQSRYFVSGPGIDLSCLSIAEGKVCWDLYIDGLVVSSDGNLLDALGAAIKAALSNTGIPKVNVIAADATSADDQPEVDVSDEEFLQFDTSMVPVIMTLTGVEKDYIIDATEAEESQMSSAISISIKRQGRICGLTKHRGAGVDPSIILDMISVQNMSASIS